MKLCFLRRKGLGAGSIRGMSAYLNSCQAREIGVRIHNGFPASVIRNEYTHTLQEMQPDILVRWGCTSQTGIPLEKQLNVSTAISLVGNKRKFRKVLRDMNPSLIPTTYFNVEEVPEDCSVILRPERHVQGRNLWLVTGPTGITHAVSGNQSKLQNGWYASDYIEKVAEYRVYVVSGRVVTVAEKTPDDPQAVAWNVAQGGRFDVVRWGQWPLEVCRVALEAFKHSGLDFSGVDVMVDADGRAYVIELNSAPSLPLLSDGSISYRQKVMAKAFKYILENGKEHFDIPERYSHWSDVIHPSTGDTR